MDGQLTSEEEKFDRRWTDARFGLMGSFMVFAIIGLALAIWPRGASNGFHFDNCMPPAFLLLFGLGCLRIRVLVNRGVERGSIAPKIGEKIVDTVSTLMFCCAFAVIELAKRAL